MKRIRKSAHYNTACAIAALALSGLVSGCAVFAPAPGIGKEIVWRKLPGWRADRHAEAWPALIAQCAVLAARPDWERVCVEAREIATPDDNQAREFFERHFAPHRMHNDRGRRDGLITGYYEPVLDGSLTRSERFRFPVEGRPGDLLNIELGELYPDLKGRRLRGRLDGHRVVPYASRSEIETRALPDSAAIAWVDDPVALFFLQIQGSGRVRLEDGTEIAVGYEDQNGHPYVAIGRVLIERGALARDQVNLFSIREWLHVHPEEAVEVMRANPSYVFFRKRDAAGAVGALGVPLAPARSIAVDPRYTTLGFPVWLDTALPDETPWQRLMFAQDTGGAIRGPVRADIFFGDGSEAERLAGTMKNEGRIYVLVPKTP
jgi:membrane-bound lytic murein transglycosylase A